ncbi:MAG: bifunctional shikimate kinase/3-dehydroquinate synthase [bacterium]|nr:bifunctional shikimate kinase/3-dehydroquinate synthase [bacterium]
MGNLWLIGMMGSGKSTVGRRIVATTGRGFIDVDSMVEERAGKSLASVFDEQGEAAFREMEGAEIRRLSGESAPGGPGRVIATGGGAVLDPAGVEAMRRSGVVAWLDAPAAVLAGRARGAGRPLLDGADTASRLAEILAGRRSLYQQAAHYRIDADRSVDVVVSEVAGCARVAVGDGSEVLIGPSLPHRLLPASSGREQAVIICQPGSRPVAGSVLEMLGSEVEATLIEVPDRDEAKSIEALALLYGRLAELNLGRHDTIVGVGGGAVTDLAGFVAATWLRGIESILVPTTLLGAVDASIGGKTGINVMGKNLVGSFWHPSRVVISLDVLSRLPEPLLLEGSAEAIKAGFIADPRLANLFMQHGSAFPMAEVVGRAVAVKAEVVSEDFRETGRRAILNFGHTLGHGIEVVCGLSHGHAVAVGMVAAAAISADRLGFDEARVRVPLERLGLPTRIAAANPDAILQLVQRDKKRTASGLRMVLLREMGDPVIEYVDEAALRLGLAAVGIAG